MVDVTEEKVHSCKKHQQLLMKSVNIKISLPLSDQFLQFAILYCMARSFQGQNFQDFCGCL